MSYFFQLGGDWIVNGATVAIIYALSLESNSMVDYTYFYIGIVAPFAVAISETIVSSVARSNKILSLDDGLILLSVSCLLYGSIWKFAKDTSGPIVFASTIGAEI